MIVLCVLNISTKEQSQRENFHEEKQRGKKLKRDGIRSCRGSYQGLSLPVPICPSSITTLFPRQIFRLGGTVSSFIYGQWLQRKTKKESTIFMGYSRGDGLWFLTYLRGKQNERPRREREIWLWGPHVGSSFFSWFSIFLYIICELSTFLKKNCVSSEKIFICILAKKPLYKVFILKVDLVGSITFES